MDENREKPWLTCHPCSEKLPMVLSGDNVDPPVQVPASITRFLRDYQRDGVRFLYNRFKEGEGGLLADDMGLGKTVQAIAFIAAVLHMKGTKEDKLRHCSAYIRNDVAPGIEVHSVDPVLIICPASLVDNWIYEFQTWGYFKVNKITTVNKFELVNQAIRRECDVIIVTFETARTMINDLNAVDWTCILVDEVHRIKDSKSQVSKALSSLNCKHRFGFTGTPFQNNMKEIWCLLKWSSPEAISKFSASDEISRLMEQGLRSSATLQDCAEKSIAQFQFSEIRTKLMLRRTKDILAKHLPSKTDQIVFCELTEVQQNIYRMITQSPDIQRLLRKDVFKEKQSKKSQTGPLFTYLHLLQKTANHVALLASGLSSKTNEVAQQVCEEALQQCAGLEGIPKKKWFSALACVNMSGKMLVLSKLLPSFLEKGDKILLFSYSTKVLDLVQKHLFKTRVKFWRLDGSTPIDSRLSLVTSFNMYPNPAIFLLSTKAGGVGLNMTGANVVIIFDPNWNPAHDLQAQDRAYRLGQQRDVRVYRLLSTATLEEFVYLRQVYKQQLGTASMTDKNTRRYFDGELFGVKNLFSFRESRRSLTEELLEKQQKLELQLRLKLEAPFEEGSFKVSSAPSAVALNGKANGSKEDKSGLTQLCEVFFKTPYNHPGMKESEDSAEDEEEEENCDDKLNENCDESIASVLERTSEVRHVVRHQNVVGPSRIEDIVADCAIRDVFEKKINFQRPAFECSVETEDIMLTDEEQSVRQKSLHSIMCRLKFKQLAEMESVTAYHLAVKVMAMSERDKGKLLRKHQEIQLSQTAGKTSNSKRARLSSLTSIESCFLGASGIEGEGPVKSATTSVEGLRPGANMSLKILISGNSTQPTKQHQSGFYQKSELKTNQDICHVSSDSGPLTCSMYHSVADVKDASTGAESSSQLSDDSSGSSSIERKVAEDCPGVSKVTVKQMVHLHCRKSKTLSRSRPNSKDLEIRSHLRSKDRLNCLSGQAGESDKALSDECKEGEIKVDEEDSSCDIDETTGGSKTATAFLSSLCVTSKRLPSPQKKCNPLSSGKHDVEGTSALSAREPLVSSTNVDSSSSSEPVSNLSNDLFSVENDCFQRLIKCGKLKPNRDCKL